MKLGIVRGVSVEELHFRALGLDDDFIDHAMPRLDRDDRQGRAWDRLVEERLSHYRSPVPRRQRR